MPDGHEEAESKMALYMTNELAFEAPDERFEDRTLHEFDAALSGKHVLGLLVMRAPMPAEGGLTEAVRAHLEGEASRLSFYRVNQFRDRLVAGSPAIEVLSGWSHGGVPLYVREVHVVSRGTRLTFSMNATSEQQEACDAYFDRMVATLEFNPR